MNVQDAKDLHITEGDVRTIHDSSGKQLWGRVNYDTKYAGDIVQQSYSGANLYNVNDPYSTYSAPVDDEGWITLSTNNAGSSVVYVPYYSKKMNVSPDTDYAVVVELKSVKSNSLTNSNNYLNITDTSNTQFSSAAYRLPFTSTNPTQPGTYVNILHTKADVNTSYGFRTFLTVSPDVDQEVTFRISLLADTSVTPETFVYQPYTGGIPAPNPDYPQTVNVVTGTQTVTITGGNVSNNFTLNLGALELCKIGTYQDYIYKSGDDWYVHKETGVTTDTVGSTDITIAGMVSNGDIYSYCGGTVAGTTVTYTSALVAVNTIYYQLATPTNTIITDATLITQLNAIHEWMTRYGYTATVSGNLPLIINQTTLS